MLLYCHSQKKQLPISFGPVRGFSLFLKELLQWLNNNDIQCDFVEDFFIFGLD